VKVLDITVAALIGLSSVAAMAAWNPNQLLAEGNLYSEQASMTEYLATVTSRLGVPWLQTASPDDVCAALVPFSNSSIQVSAQGRNFLCSTLPPPSVPQASITLQLAKGNLTLQAWRPGKQ
jgi:hypothetical protein